MERFVPLYWLPDELKMPRPHRGVVAWLYRLPELKLFNLSHPPVFETIFYLRITDSIPFPAHKINFRL